MARSIRDLPHALRSGGELRRLLRGKRPAVFLDYDGTLIRGFSAAAFYGHRLRSAQMGPRELATLLAATQQDFSGEGEFARFMDDSLRHWAGLADDELDALGRRLFKEEIAARLHREAYEIVEAHRAMAHTLVLVSSALRYQTGPIAEALGFDHVLDTAVELGADGRLTGRTDGPPMYGPAKASALVRLADRVGADLV